MYSTVLSHSKNIVLILVLFLYSSGLLFSQSHIWSEPEKPGKLFKLTSGYFIIWYEEKDLETAITLANAGNGFYKDFKNLFGNKSPQKVYIRINSRTGFANGSYQTAPPVINFYTQSFPVASKGFDWNYYLLVHEFVHYMHLEYKGGMSNVLYYIFGPMGKMYPLYLTPYWQIEGLATAIESDYTNSGRYQNPFFTMPFRADILLDRVENYNQISLTYGDDEFANFSRRYQYGVQLIYSIKEDYGYEKIVELWQNFMRFPLGYKQRHKKFMGVEMEDLYQDMINKSKQKYSNFINWNRGEELYQKDNSRARYVILANSKKGILFSTQGTDVKSSYNMLNPVSKKITKLINAPMPNTDIFYNQTADISYDSELLVFIKPTANTDIVDPTGFEAIGYYNDLYSYNINTNKEYRLTRRQQLFAPILSPDKKYVYLSQFTDSGNQSRLIRIDLDNPSAGYRIIYEKENSSIVYKAISPDSKKIIFVEKSSELGIRLLLFDIETMQYSILLSQDYGLEIHSLRFLSNTIISLVSEIEYNALTTLYYEIDISQLRETHTQASNIRIKRVAKDKVGIDSAIKDDNATLWYVSHNSRGYSIYSYSKNKLEDYEVDQSKISSPNYFSSSQLSRNENIDTSNTIVDEINTAAETTGYTITRSYGAIPSRPVYWVPYFYLQKSNTKLQYYDLGEISYHTKFESPNNRAKFLLGLKCYYIENISTLCAENEVQDNIGFDISYNYTFPRLGNVSIYSSRIRNNLLGISSNSSVLRHQLILGTSYGRILVYSPNNLILRMKILSQLQYTDIEVLRTDLNTKSSVLNTALLLPLTWHSPASTKSKNSTVLSWNINPSISYQYMFDPSKEHSNIYEENEFWFDNIYFTNNSFFQFPIFRQLGMKISNYSVWYNKGEVLTNRFNRYKPQYLYQPILGNEATVKLLSNNGVAIVNTYPFQSSFALDLTIKSNLNFGGNLIEFYQFYLNTFISQNSYYDNTLKVYAIADHLILGTEAGMKIRVAIVPLSLNLGLGYKIPYHNTSNTDYFMYIGIGTNDIFNEVGYSSYTYP